MQELPPTPPTIPELEAQMPEESISEPSVSEEQAAVSEENTLPVTTKIPPFVWMLLILVAFGLGLGAGYMVWAQPEQARAVAAEQKVATLERSAVEGTSSAATQQANAGDQKVTRYNIPINNNAILGKTDAPITIIEFSDYQCPYCQSWNKQTWTQIKAKYGDKVRFVYMDFPLDSIHPEAVPAAEAADCAGEQDHYYDYHDLLFSGSKTLGADTYQAYAEQLGLKMDQFKQCVSDRKYQKEVESDLSFASNLGVRSTPTFFINGLALVGAQSFDVFDQIITLELKGQIPQ